jgi:osmotically-inducible protein OsmY
MIRTLFSPRFITGVAAGAALFYFLDPDQGRTRRARTSDQFQARVRRAGREAERKARYYEGKVEGMVHEARPDAARDGATDDRTVAHRIESQVLRSDRFPGAQVNVDVVDGVATLRGEVRNTGDLGTLAREVAAVRGVKAVQSYLHLPGTPAPNKAEALQAT